MGSGCNQRCFDLRHQLFSKLDWQFNVRSAAISVCDGQHNRPVICGSGVDVAHYYSSSATPPIDQKLLGAAIGISPSIIGRWALLIAHRSRHFR